MTVFSAIKIIVNTRTYRKVGRNFIIIPGLIRQWWVLEYNSLGCKDERKKYFFLFIEFFIIIKNGYHEIEFKMPANLSPDYYRAEEDFKNAQTPHDRLKALKGMYAAIPKHKGTEKMQADLKRRISQTNEEIQKSGKRKEIL